MAWRLLSLKMNHEPVVYMDETKVTVNNLKCKTWQLRGLPIYAPKNENFVDTVTVYGAISTPSVLAQPLFMIGTAT